MKELRFYCVLESATDKSKSRLLSMCIDDFADEAEKNGFVYSLEGVKRMLMRRLPEDTIMRVALVKDGQIVREIFS